MQFIKIIKILRIVFISGFLSVLLFISSIALGLFGKLPNPEELEKTIIKTNEASTVYDRNEEILGRYFIDNRTPVTFKQLGPFFPKALVATEEVRFYESSGIDLLGLLSVGYYLLRGKKRGASTLSQQLAKNLFKRNRDFIVITKIKEMITAVKIERMYTKEEIISLYLNIVEYPYNSLGIYSASKTYFNKIPSKLKLEEAALLVGMAKGPSFYNPRRHPKRALDRRNTVLAQMNKYGYLSTQTFNELKEKPIKLNFKRATHMSGTATYFRGELAKTLKEWCKENGYNLYTDGLKIYTSIDKTIQQYAENSVKEHFTKLQPQFRKNLRRQKIWRNKSAQNALARQMKQTERYRRLKAKKVSESKITKIFNTKRDMSVFYWNGYKNVKWSPMDSLKHYITFLQTGVLATNPSSGKVLAWVGGINYRHFKYDHIFNQRQLGSVFKPLIYAWDIEKGNPPCELLKNRLITFDKKKWKLGADWQPKNSGLTSLQISKRDALRKSLNIPTASIVQRWGPEGLKIFVDEFSKKLGINSENKPSICLGTGQVSLSQIVPVYSSFSNGGELFKPHFLLRIENKKGQILEAFTNKNIEIMGEDKSATMIEMLKGTTEAGGTAYRLRSVYKLPNEMAGKTATTNDHKDGWFMTVLPKLTIGVWSGCDEPAFHFDNIRQGQGANMALPIAGNLIKKLNKNPRIQISEKDTFNLPENFVKPDCSFLEDQLQPEEKDEDEDFDNF